MIPPRSLVSAIAPTGRLRAAINLGAAAHTSGDRAGTEQGVAVDIAVELARQLGLELDLVGPMNGDDVDIRDPNAADIGFFEMDSHRRADIALTEPYLLIAECYLVKEGPAIWSVDQRTYGRLSVCDRLHGRTVVRAQLMRTATSPTVVDTFMQQGSVVAADVRQKLDSNSDCGGASDQRLVDGQFTMIQHALGVPTARGPLACAYVTRFVERIKASGFLAASLKRHRIESSS